MTQPIVVASFGSGPHAVAGGILKAAGCDVRTIPATTSAWTEALITEFAPVADAWIGTFPKINLPRAVLERAPRTRVIASSIIGTEMIDVAAATDLGIVVAHGAVAENYDGMAEAGVMLIAALLKDLPGKMAALAEGRWKPIPAGRMVDGAVIGMIGLGRIGQGIARRLAGWNCRIVATDPYVDPLLAAQLGVALLSLDQLLAQSDVVLPLVTLSDETRNIVDRAAIGRMKRGAVLINIGRGGCVDENALLEALNSGHLSGAAIDTWEIEPTPYDNPLRTHPCVIATGHAVGHSEELYRRLPEVAAENVLLALAGKTPLHVRNPEVLGAWCARMAALD
jgi:phosphoglycerate dehydrogenase-like enzyme